MLLIYEAILTVPQYVSFGEFITGTGFTQCPDCNGSGVDPSESRICSGTGTADKDNFSLGSAYRKRL